MPWQLVSDVPDAALHFGLVARGFGVAMSHPLGRSPKQRNTKPRDGAASASPGSSCGLAPAGDLHLEGRSAKRCGAKTYLVASCRVETCGWCQGGRCPLSSRF